MPSTTKPAASLNLVDYPSSSEDELEVPQPPLKKRKASASSSASTPAALPPLPDKFHDLYTTAPRLSAHDDPSVHNGRMRAIPHVEGNWPMHIFLEWHPTTIETQTINSIILSTKESITNYLKWNPTQGDSLKLHSFLTSGLGVQLPLHVSLSRPIVLQADARVGFMEDLEKRIGKCDVEPFDIAFTSLAWVANQDRTRWFYVLRAASPSNELATLLHLCNQVCSSQKQPELYAGRENEGFHVSIAWTLGEPSLELKEDIEKAVKEAMDGMRDVKMEAKVVKVKIGNVVSLIGLRRDLT